METISNVPSHITARKAYLKKMHRPQNKAFIRGASHGVSDQLRNKNVKDGQRWDVASQERKV